MKSPAIVHPEHREMRNLLMDIQYQKPPIYSVCFRFPPSLNRLLLIQVIFQHLRRLRPGNKPPGV